MECQKIISRRLKTMLIVLILLVISTTNWSYATSVTPTATTSTGGPASEPHIEMRVETVNKGASNQILVKCWASNFTNLESLETVFTYNSTILQPSDFTTNEVLTDLDSIKYDKRPSSTEGQWAFDIASTDKLIDSFAFDSAYLDKLDVDLFRYLAPSGDNEAMQFVISKKDDTVSISSTDYILIGTFSFRQIDETQPIEAGVFDTRRIRVICDDGVASSGEVSDYWREAANGEDCTELMEYVYQQYGSISGIIAINVKNTKNIATIKVFEKGKTMDWTDFKNYKANRLSLPVADYEYTTVEADGGVFFIDKIPYGEYEILIDKENYLDYIITNVVIDKSNKDIDLNSLIGNIELLPGDFNKDGKVTLLDKTSFFDKGYKNKPKDEKLDLNDDGKLTLTDKTIFDTLYKKAPKDNRVLVTL